MNPHVKKLCKGIALFSVFHLLDYFVGGVDGLNSLKKQCVVRMDFISEETASFILTLIALPIQILLVYCFVSGLYRICTCGIINSVFDHKN